MKKLSFLILVICVAACNSNETKSTETETAAVTTTVAKTDLTKINWIAGNWRGMYEGKPFYEQYDFPNDSTLRIISYEWNGKDTSRSSYSYVSWKGDTYYLGDSSNYKTTLIDGSKIEMIPNYKANNNILWAYVNDSTWNAILKGKTKTNEYKMERLPAIDSMYKAGAKN